jgi:Fis family transcriptional regulator
MMEPRQTLRSCVSTVLNDYFAQVDPEMINGLYEMVLSEVEAPLLEAVMQKARSNQSRAAQMLGVNRGTLRKKLRQYDML